MELLTPIPTETLQLLSIAEVTEYRLVPYLRKGDTVRCYGERGTDYSEIIGELEVLHGWSCEVEPIACDELQRIMERSYRSAMQHAPTTRTVEIEHGRTFLFSLIDEALRDNASDIHLEPGESRCRVRLRIDGALTERYVIGLPQYASLVNQVKILANLDISEKRLPQDGRIGYDGNGAKFDVRISTLPTIYGEKVVLRLLTRRTELLELSNLGFTERQHKDYLHAVTRSYGMVLICGPTGSGKSTTLYATLRQLNKSADNILTIEDPVEYTLEGVNQVQLKEEIGLTFTTALRTFLRQDPDIIMLGEIRDPATAEMAVRASLTGHLLFSTIHTNTAWGAVSRLTDMGIHPYMIADTLAMTVAQRLVRLLCRHCKRKVATDETVLRLLPEYESEYYYESAGCPHCYYTGYAGRQAIYEVIPLDSELAAAARSGCSDIAEQIRRRGITSLRDAVIDLFVRGATDLSEVIPLLNE